MQALDPEFRSIRKEGASFDREEYLLGIVCMAVPILHGNRAVAAVALHAAGAVVHRRGPRLAAAHAAGGGGAGADV